MKKHQGTIQLLAPECAPRRGLRPAALLRLAGLTWAAWGPAVFALPVPVGAAVKAAVLLLCPALCWLLAGWWGDWGRIYALLGAVLALSAGYRGAWQGVLLLLNAFLSSGLAGGRALPFAVEVAHPDLVGGGTLFLLLTVFCLLLDLCLDRRLWLGTALLSGAPAALALWAGAPAAALLPSGLVFAFVWSGLLFRGARTGDGEPGGPPPASFFLLVGGAAILLGGAALLWRQTGTTLEPALAQTKRELVQAVEKARYEGDGVLPLLAGGDLRRQAVEFTGETVLRVTLQRPRSVYLKGFTGGTYADGVWSPPGEPETAGEAYRGLMLYLTGHGFYPQVQVGETTVLVEETETAWITVENLAAGRKYLFTPYEALQVSDLSEDHAGYREESGIRAQGLFGAEKYTFAMALPRTEDYALADLSAFSETLPEETAALEKLYRTYVYDAFLDVSEEERELLLQCFDAQSLEELRGADLAAVTWSLRTCFSEKFTFDYGALTESDGDVLARFLGERAGNQTHFATLATLLFREVGIPARYAEGYYLSPGDVAIYTSMPSIVFDLPDHSAHAWVEVYVNGLGWVPVEVTPGFYTEEEGDRRVPSATDLLQETPEYLYQRDEEVPPVREEPAEQGTEPERELPLWLWLAAALAVWPVGSALCHGARKRRFRQRDTRRGVLAVYAYTARLLRAAGCPLPPQGPMAGARAAGTRFDLPEEGTLHGFLLLAYRARYARQPPDRSQAEAAERYAAGLARRLCREKPWPWRVWSWMIGRI